MRHLKYYLLLSTLSLLYTLANPSWAVTFKQVSAGDYHTCTVLKEGEAVCWGNNNKGQASPPLDLMSEVAVGDEHSCGIKKADHQVICWGDDSRGQKTPPSGAFLQLVAGTDYTCGLKSDGSIACWGTTSNAVTTPPEGAFVQISAGNYHACGLKTDGTIACWGHNGYGQGATQSGTFMYVGAGERHTCGIRSDGTISCWGSNVSSSLNAPSGNFFRLEAGKYHTCAWKTDGSTVCWGNDNYGQATVSEERFTQISAGREHSCGVTTAGNMRCWGAGNTSDSGSPHYGQAAILPAPNYTQISAGNIHTCALKSDGSVACWGNNSSARSTPPSGSFSQIALGGSHSCGLKSDGSIACWGYNNVGQSTPPSGSFSQIALGDAHSCGLKSDGSIACWGSDSYGQSTPPSGSFSQIALGTWHSCGLKIDGSIACWGRDNYGQSTPPSDSFSQITLGAYHSCGLKSDGSVACWGRDNYAQTTPPSDSFSHIALGTYNSCGLKSDGSVACWGYNGNGQSTPPSGSFSQLALGNTHSCGLTTDDALVCWGHGSYTNAPQILEIQIPPLSLFSLSPSRGVSPLTVQANASAAYDPNGNIVSYLWTASNGQQKTDKTTEFNFTIPGTYTITLTVTDNEGAIRTQSKMVEVSACAYSFSPSSRTLSSTNGVTSSIEITATGSGCNWTASNDANWLSMLSGSSGSGNETLTYRVETNTTTSSRTANINIAGYTLPITQPGASICSSYSLSTTTKTVSSQPISGSITVTASPAGCVGSWTASSNANWVTLSSSSGNGDGTVSYSIAANNNSTDRSAELSIAGRTVNITQQEYANIVGSFKDNGDGTVVDLATGDIWQQDYDTTPLRTWYEAIDYCENLQLAGHDDWQLPLKNPLTSLYMVFDSSVFPQHNTGVSHFWSRESTSGSEAYAVKVATGSHSSLDISNTFHTKCIISPCNYTLSSSQATHGGGKEIGHITVTAAEANCSWTASSDESWINITNGINHSGDAVVSYEIQDNASGAQRSGSLNIAGLAFNVTQGFECTYTLSSTSRQHAAEATSDSVTISASHSHCPWTASSNASWVNLSNTSGTGSGILNYSLQTNTGDTPRNTSLNIAGSSFTLNQIAGSIPCTYTLSPANAQHSSNSETGHVSINMPTGCSWAVSSTGHWLRLTSPASGTDSTTLSYQVDKNSTSTPRNASLEIAGYVFPINQAGADDCLSITPSSHHFGSVVPGQQSVDQTFHVTNSCQGHNVNIALAAMTGTAEFSLSSDQCSGQTLGYQQSCTVDAYFRPTHQGAQTAVLAVQYGAGKTTQATLNASGALSPPTACLNAIQLNGLIATLDAGCSTDSNGSIVRYDWQLSSTVSPTLIRSGATSSESFQLSAPGRYTVLLTVADNDGHTNSTSQTIEAGYSIRLDNISVRCHIQPSPKTAIAGFVIEGTGTKKVLLRGLAVPSMSPSLDLHISLNKFINNTWQEILSNDNWMQSSRANEISALPSHLVPRSSNDAALLVDLEPGVYTLIAAPQGTSGIGVVSADDLDDSIPSSRLVNISGRCAVESGNGNAIAGFVIEGDGTLKNLLRGMRTASTELSAQLDPRLELVHIYPNNPNADVLETNNNWEDHPRAGEISSLPINLQLRDHRDSAIIRDMPTGVFTVLMKPNGALGIGVVSVDAVK